MDCKAFDKKKTNKFIDKNWKTKINSDRREAQPNEGKELMWKHSGCEHI